MSDEEEENPSEENEEEEEEEDEEEEEEDDQQDQQEGQEDEDGEEQEEDENQDQEGEDEQQQDQNDEKSKSQEEKKDFVPKFRSIEADQFKISSILSEISSLSHNVDSFINTLPSNGGSHYRSYLPPAPKYYPPPQIPLVIPQEPKIVIMKDEDVQVSMQPQIVIQPTKLQKAPAEPSYKISNQSNKFLAQLYQQNKKLKRWQNSTHNVNSHKALSSIGSGFYGSRQRFERQEYQKGIFNVDERNKEIDEAIQKLRLQDQ